MTQHLFPRSIKAGVELDPAAIQVYLSQNDARFVFAADQTISLLPGRR